MRLGCDPEVFLLNNQGLLPVFGLVGGDKWNPKQIEGMADGFTLQEDNVALEFGIPPAASKQEFVKSVKDVQFAFLNKHPNLSFSNLSCAVFPGELLEHPQAHVFGCEPDFNAWNNRENPRPRMKKNTRAAGGHVHVELPPESSRELVVQAMDFYLGLPSLLMDKDAERRKMYGKAGAFRPKSYGVEYRTLSNFWIFKDRLVEWVWDNTERALNSVGQGEEFQAAAMDIQRIINTSNLEEAKILVEAYDLEVI